MIRFRWWLLQVEYCCLLLIFSHGRNRAREAFQGPFYKGTNPSWPNHLPFLISIGLLGRYSQSITPPIEMTFFSLDFLEMRLFWEFSIKLTLNFFPASLPPEPHSQITGHGPVRTHLSDLLKWEHVFLFFFSTSVPLNVGLCIHISQRFISVFRVLMWKIKGALTTSQMLPRV